MKLLRPFKHLVKHFRRYVRVGIVGLLVLAGGVAYYGKQEASRLECNYLQLPESALPTAGPVRIAFVSDIHNSPDIMRQVVEHLQTARPDIILLGGDYVSADQRFMRTRWFIDSLRALADIAPVFAILGNHDYEKLGQVERVLQTAEIPLLRNEARTWETPSGGSVCLVGLGDWNEGDEDPHTCLLPEGEEESSVLLLSHDPESRWHVRQYDWDLMLSGHTHAGQLGNPFATPTQFISFRSSMPAGLFDFEDTHRVFVSRGAGSTFGMRFFCPPEINIIDIGDRASLVPQDAQEDTAASDDSAEEQEAEESIIPALPTPA